jgi:hypothetical protein
MDIGKLGWLYRTRSYLPASFRLRPYDPAPHQRRSSRINEANHRLYFESRLFDFCYNQVDQVDGFTNAYSKYLAPNGELNGLGIAIGSRLIPQS